MPNKYKNMTAILFGNHDTVEEEKTIVTLLKSHQYLGTLLDVGCGTSPYKI
jgi:ubiquinone/menaquinone biosynthesis C-methylase UbiE